MTTMRFYFPNFLRGQWYSQRRRFARGPVELTALSDYILRDIGVAQ
jgi:uncharacterized protein YjiS (DUF1127 family)